MLLGHIHTKKPQQITLTYLLVTWHVWIDQQQGVDHADAVPNKLLLDLLLARAIAIPLIVSASAVCTSLIPQCYCAFT